MNIVILHISELSAMVLTGNISLRADRIATLDDQNSIKNLLEQAGYLKYSEPEAYILCIPKSGLVKGDQSISRVIQLCIEDFIEIVPLTNDAKRSLNPTIERLHLKLLNPRWENDWAYYVDKAILNDRLLAAQKFAGFFNISYLDETEWSPHFGTYEFIIADIGVGQSQIEKQMEFADLGVLEFCIRIANNHDKTWREQDANYASLKLLRLKHLSGKNKNEFSFIDSPKICNALKFFEKESKKTFGYSPFALSAFFEIYRRFLVSKIFDLNAIRSLAIKFIEYNLNRDANDFIHLIGYASGLELIMPLDYSLNKGKYSIVNLTNPSLPKLTDLHIPPFCGYRSPFELPNIVNVKTTSNNLVTEEDCEPKLQIEDITIPARVNAGPKIQERVTSIKKELNNSDSTNNIPDLGKETSFSLTEPIKPQTRAKKSLNEKRLKEPKSKKGGIKP